MKELPINENNQSNIRNANDNNNCTKCKWLDQNYHGPKGDGYCCMVVRSKTYKEGDRARYSNMARCELYEIGEFTERYKAEEPKAGKAK